MYCRVLKPPIPHSWRSCRPCIQLEINCRGSHTNYQPYMKALSGWHFTKLSPRSFHVAVVGSGPSGYYTVEELYKSHIPNIQISMFEKLPTPYGLVRSGVAPDHPEVKAVENVFQNLSLKKPNFTFYGNVEVGKDIHVEQLKRLYSSIVFCYGAEDDRKLGVEGEELAGVYSAREFVEWYNAKPGSQSRHFDLSLGESAVIIGNGNVALDVARILSRRPDTLASTDISSDALKEISKSRIRRIHIVGRRGPVQSAFTTKEIRELIQLKSVYVHIESNMLLLSEQDQIELKLRANNRKFQLLMNLINKSTPDQKVNSIHKTYPSTIKEGLLNEANVVLSGQEKRGNSERNIFLDFLKQPVAFIEDPLIPGHLSQVKFEHTSLTGMASHQRVKGTDHFSTMKTSIVFKSIGYHSHPLDDLPFDNKLGIIPNNGGKVQDGIYVAGWLARGPTGIIATNKLDAQQVAFQLEMDYKKGILSDQRTVSGQLRVDDPDKEVLKLLANKSVRIVSFQDWKIIDEEEQRRGRALGKIREKISCLDQMLACLPTQS